VATEVGPSWSRFFGEFRCRGCGVQEAYSSRPRGFFERYVLPLLFLQTVRCGRCYHRAYALRTVPTIERLDLEPKKSQAETGDPKSDRRIA